MESLGGITQGVPPPRRGVESLGSWIHHQGCEYGHGHFHGVMGPPALRRGAVGLVAVGCRRWRGATRSVGLRSVALWIAVFMSDPAAWTACPRMPPRASA